MSWSSKRQQTIAASITEAECMAAAAAVKEALWLRNLLADFNIQITPVTLFADNPSAIKLLHNPISSLRNKHIDVIHHFASERVIKGGVVFCYIKTDDMLGDIISTCRPKALCLLQGHRRWHLKTKNKDIEAVAAVRVVDQLWSHMCSQYNTQTALILLD